MKKILMLIIISIIVMGLANVSGLALCQEHTDIDDIPCLGLTRILSCSGNITVLNINSSTYSNITSFPIGDGTYNFTFNKTRASYSLIACDNSTATLEVGDFEGDKLWKFAVILGFISVAFLYALFGKIVFESQQWGVKTFLYLIAVLIILLGIQSGVLMSYYDTRTTSLISVSSTITLSIIGILFLYMMIFTFINTVKAVKEAKEQKQSEI